MTGIPSARPALDTLGTALGSLLGGLLGGPLAVVAALRRGRPLHPRGRVVPARLVLDGGAPELGPVLGRAAELDGVARVSRAMGLPEPRPDIGGLAVRWSGRDGPNDLLLAATGLSPVTRHVLALRRVALGGPLSTLMPFAGPRGPVEIAAVPSSDGVNRELELRWARPTGRWRTFGTLHLDLAGPVADRADLRFDPVAHCPDGLETYPWAAALRVPAYRWSRRVTPRG